MEYSDQSSTPNDPLGVNVGDAHGSIDADNVVERYVLGRLDDAEQVLFEDHFVDCARCLEAVELAQELHDGMVELKGVADAQRVMANVAVSEAAPVPLSREPLPGEPLPFRRPTDEPRSRPSPWMALAAAAIVAIAILPSWWLAQRNQTLQERVTRLERPYLGTPDALLELQRDVETARLTVTTSPDADWLTLAIDVGDLAGSSDDVSPRVDVSLVDAHGAELWSATDLAAPRRGPLSLTLPLSMVPAATYRLDVSLRRDDRVEPVGSFEFTTRQVN